MENATKALMIAAAILVAILVISLGIGIFNNASEQAEGAGNLSEYQVQTHNDKFRKYEGASVTGSEVNALLTTVFTHNNAQDSTSTCVQVTGASTIALSNAITKSPTKVDVGARYKVELSYDTKTDLVNKITITKL